VFLPLLVAPSRKKLDVITNDLLKRALRFTGKLGVLASEEEDAPVRLKNLRFCFVFVFVFFNFDLTHAFFFGFIFYFIYFLHLSIFC